MDTDMVMSHMYNPVSQEERDALANSYKDQDIEDLDPNEIHGKVEKILDIQFEMVGKPLSMAYRRYLTIINVSYIISKLFTDASIQRKDPLKTYSAKEQEEFSKLSGKGSKADVHVDKDHDKAQGPRLGQRDVHKLAQMDPTGLYYLYSMLASFGHTPCDNIPHMVYYMLSASPVLYCIVDRIMEQMENPTVYGLRSLCLADSPMAQ